MALVWATEIVAQAGNFCARGTLSEYQYYEFRAIDKPLTREQMAEMRKVSSRGRITSTSYVNEYEWGDFKGDPDDWIDRYFDVFLYYANWGTKILKFKLPSSVLSKSLVDEFTGEGLSVRTSGDSTVVTFWLESDDGIDEEFEEDEDVMGSLIAIRSELANGDLRSLYLGWLINRWIEEEIFERDAEEDEYDEDRGPEDDGEMEPPTPAGLNELTASQQALVDFFDIDEDLISAAATGSAEVQRAEMDKGTLAAWIAGIDAERQSEYLLRVLGGDGDGLALELNAKFREETGTDFVADGSGSLRTFRELCELAAKIRDARHERKAEQEAEATKKRLDALFERRSLIWAQVHTLANVKKTNEYEQAVRLLVQLRELADRGDIPDFEERVLHFRELHSSKRALLDRLDREGLPG
jgi:hypothetical protein